jgi:dTDP-glucose 4,6-dehydratase
MARVLITGSKGVVGTWLTQILESRGLEVFGVDLHHAVGETGWEQRMSTVPGKYCRCDVSDFRQLERVFERHGPFDFVYHAAAEFGRWNGEDFYEQVWRTNAIGTKHIIRLQEKLRFKLVHFSSSEVYGEFNEVMTESTLEAHPIEQLNDYAISKRVNELQIRNSTKYHGTETVVVRLFNTYGPGEWFHPYRSVNAKFCYSALHGLPIVVHRGHWRTSTYLEDTARTLANIVINFKPGERYNIGGSDYHDIETLASIIWKVSGADPKLITVKDPEAMTTINKRVDVSKAVQDLQHKSTVSLEKGIVKTVDWMREYYGITSSRKKGAA